MGLPAAPLFDLQQHTQMIATAHAKRTSPPPPAAAKNMTGSNPKIIPIPLLVPLPFDEDEDGDDEEDAPPPGALPPGQLEPSPPHTPHASFDFPELATPSHPLHPDPDPPHTPHTSLVFPLSTTPSHPTTPPPVPEAAVPGAPPPEQNVATSGHAIVPVKSPPMVFNVPSSPAAHVTARVFPSVPTANMDSDDPLVHCCL